MLFSEREPSPRKYKYKRFGDETINLFICRSLSDCLFVHLTHAQLLFRSVQRPFSYPELRSSWPAPRIESSGRDQFCSPRIADFRSTAQPQGLERERRTIDIFHEALNFGLQLLGAGDLQLKEKLYVVCGY